MASVLFVCLGNICRSPAAEGLLRHIAHKINFPLALSVESRGVGDWSIGQRPDERMQKAALIRGVVLSGRAQVIEKADFDTFDYILSADRDVLYTLYQKAPEPYHKAKVHLITHFSASYKDEDIPDPYYGDAGTFELVLDILEDSCEGLLQHLVETSLR